MAEPTFIIQSSHKASVTCMAWLPGDRLVTGSYDMTVRIWNLADGTQVGTTMVHKLPIVDIVATRDGRIVSSCPSDNHPLVWNADTQELLEEPQLNEDYGPPHRITLSQNEDLLATSHYNCIVFWDMLGTTRFKSIVRIDHLERFNGEAEAIRLSPNGMALAVLYLGMLCVLDVESGERIFGPLDQVWLYTVSWSLDGARLFCGTGPTVHCFNSRTGELIGEPWTGGHEPGHRVHCESFSPEGKWLATGSDKGVARFWDVETCKPVGEPLLHPYWIVRTMAFSRSGEFLASCSDVIILIWRVPLWDDRKALHPLLDVPAVVSPDDPANIPDPGSVDMSAPRQPLPHPQDHSRDNPSDDLTRMQGRELSRSWWMRIPRLTLHRIHSVYPGHAPPRTAVASSSTVDNSERSHSQTTSTSSSHSDSGDNSSDAPTPAGDLEIGEAGCCGLWSRRQARRTAARARRAVPTERSSHNIRPPGSDDAGIPVLLSSHTAAQDILDLPAVVRSTDTP